MKYFAVFLAIVLLQLTLVDETIAQRSRTNTGRIGSQAPTLTDLELSAQVGYKKFWDKQSQGFSIYLDGDVLFYLNQAIGLGAFGYVAGGGGQYNDGFYQEPSFNWRSGIKGKFRTGTSDYSLSFGYGQNLLHGEIASGLKDVVFSDFLVGRLQYQAYGRRLAEQAWLPAMGVYLEGKKALTKEIPVWGNYAIDYELVPEIVKGAVELTVVDIIMGELAIPWGVTGAVNIYDFKNSKVFYEVGTWLSPNYANNNMGKIYFAYQNGITGIKGINRFIAGISLDLTFPFKINQNNNTQINTEKRRRTR